MYEITIKICTVVSGTAGKNDDCHRKGREGGGQRVMIEIIISVNDENDGRPLRRHLLRNLQTTLGLLI